mgnify:CR=1 FL=1
MFYAYILISKQRHKFYFGSAKDLRERLRLHNEGKVQSTKYGIPWRLVWYGAFGTEQEARNFEQYLKNGSGKSFAYKRLIPVALKKDFGEGRKSSPKLKA